MQFVLLIYQGTTPLPGTDPWNALSETEQKQVYVDYAALHDTPGFTPGIPLGLPADAVTVRVEDGEPRTAPGPYLDVERAVGGYVTLESDDLDGAVRLASRIPPARMGGAIEIRPAATYW